MTDDDDDNKYTSFIRVIGVILFLVAVVILFRSLIFPTPVLDVSGARLVQYNSTTTTTTAASTSSAQASIPAELALNAQQCTFWFRDRRLFPGESITSGYARLQLTQNVLGIIHTGLNGMWTPYACITRGFLPDFAIWNVDWNRRSILITLKAGTISTELPLPALVPNGAEIALCVHSDGFLYVAWQSGNVWVRAPTPLQSIQGNACLLL